MTLFVSGGFLTCHLVQLRVGKYQIGTVVLTMAVQPTQQLTLGEASEFL
jgi:hypothetical protein